MASGDGGVGRRSIATRSPHLKRSGRLLLTSSLTSVCNPVDRVGSTGDFSPNPGDFRQFAPSAIARRRAPCQTHTQPNHLLCSLPRGEEPAGSAKDRATDPERLRRRRAEGSARIGSAGTWKQEPVAGPPAARQAGLLRTEPEPPEAAAIGRDRVGSEEAGHLCGVARPLETIRTEAPRSRPAQAGKLLGASPFQPTGASRRAARGLTLSADRRKPQSRQGPHPFRWYRRPASSTRPPRSDTAGTARPTPRESPEQALRADRRPGQSPCGPPDRRWARHRAGAA